jgi:hypothetical protein
LMCQILRFTPTGISNDSQFRALHINSRRQLAK